MVIRDRCHDQDGVVVLEPFASDHSNDKPPSYETISTACASGQPNRPPTISSVPKKLTSQPSRDTRNNTPSGSTSCQVGRSSQSNLSFASPFPSPNTSKQVRQTILMLIRNLVLNAESPNLLDSCANACRTYRLNLSVLLQERFIDDHSALYWVILKGRDALVPTMLVHAYPLSEETKSEIYRACLAAANQNLFHSLRCYRPSLRSAAMPLVSTTHTLVLGSTPSDEVSVHEIGSEGAFVAKIRVNLWQRRMRAGAIILVDFIARGRIWRLMFITPPPSDIVGRWRVGVCLLEHSPPTFIDSKLLIDLPPVSDSLTQASDLISLSPPSDDPRSAAAIPPLPTSSSGSESESKAPQTIKIHLNSQHRLAYRLLDHHVEQWTGKDGKTYTNGILVSLDEGAGAELLYENTPFVASDGTLHLRFEAQLEKPKAARAAFTE